MLRLSKLSDYAVVVLVRLARVDGVQTAPGIATRTGIPEPTVGKVLKMLAASGLVSSQRGARGGYRLARPLDRIAVADVVVAVDGPIRLTACTGASGACEAETLCPMRGRWDPVDRAIRHALASVSLAAMCLEDAPAPLARTAVPSDYIDLPGRASPRHPVTIAE